MLNSVADDVDTKIRYATEVVAASMQTLCRCKVQTNGADTPTSLIPADADYVVFGDPTGPEIYQAVEYLQSLGLKARGVDADTVPDECRTFDLAFLPIVLNVRTGELFVNNPSTARHSFDAWRQ